MNSYPLKKGENVEVVRHDFRENRSSPVSAKSATVQDETALRELLKRCSPVTVASVCEYRKTRDPIHLSLIVVGIIERYIDRDLRMKLRPPNPELRLVEDLGVDSLTMMEIVLLAEEAVDISINTEELRPLRTIGDVVRFVETKSHVGDAG